MTDPMPLIYCQVPTLVFSAGGVMAAAIIAIGIRVQQIQSIGNRALERQAVVAEAITKLETMHIHADDYGFGTKGTNQKLSDLITSLESLVEENRRVSDSLYRLTHYIVFDIKHRTGRDPPPPPPNGV